MGTSIVIYVQQFADFAISFQKNTFFQTKYLLFTELISPSVNSLLEGKMTLGNMHLLHQCLLYIQIHNNIGIA